MTSSNLIDFCKSTFYIIIDINIINYLYMPNFSFMGHLVTKILAISCFIVFKMTTSSNSTYFVSCFEFQCHNGNQHHQLLRITSSYQISASHVISSPRWEFHVFISFKMMMSSNSISFCGCIRISIP